MVFCRPVGSGAPSLASLTTSAVLPMAALAPLKVKSPATGGSLTAVTVTSRDTMLLRLLTAGAVVDLEGDRARAGGRVLAAVGEADVAQRGLVVGDRARAAEGERAGGGVEGGGGDAVLGVGAEAEDVLAVDVAGADRDRGADEVGAVDVGRRRCWGRSTVARAFSV